METTEKGFKIITYEGEEGLFIPKDKLEEVLASLQAQGNRDVAQAALFALLDEGFEFGQHMTTSREELHERTR